MLPEWQLSLTRPVSHNGSNSGLLLHKWQLFFFGIDNFFILIFFYLCIMLLLLLLAFYFYFGTRNANYSIMKENLKTFKKEG